MNILIVDDERLARNELTRLLADIDDINIVGEAENIKNAQKIIESTAVDLLLLDISMPEGDGFELLEKLTTVPDVIFTTAYDQHALKAFEVNALDYLMKPIEPQRLSAAIDKVRASQEDDLPSIPAGPLTYEERVFVKDGEQCWFVNIADIVLLESIGNYTRIYFDDCKPMIKRSLNQMADRLPTKQFMRANRRFMFNRNAMEKVESIEGGRLLLILKGDHQIEMSRRQSLQLREQWGL